MWVLNPFGQFPCSSFVLFSAFETFVLKKPLSTGSRDSRLDHVTNLSVLRRVQELQRRRAHGTNTDHFETGYDSARADGKDHYAIRGEGAAGRRHEDGDDHRRTCRGALCAAQGQAVLREAG